MEKVEHHRPRGRVRCLVKDFRIWRYRVRTSTLYKSRAQSSGILVGTSEYFNLASNPIEENRVRKIARVKIHAPMREIRLGKISVILVQRERF